MNFVFGWLKQVFFYLAFNFLPSVKHYILFATMLLKQFFFLDRLCSSCPLFLLKIRYKLHECFANLFLKVVSDFVL